MSCRTHASASHLIVRAVLSDFGPSQSYQWSLCLPCRPRLKASDRSISRFWFCKEVQKGVNVNMGEWSDQILGLILIVGKVSGIGRQRCNQSYYETCVLGNRMYNLYQLDRGSVGSPKVKVSGKTQISIEICMGYMSFVCGRVHAGIKRQILKSTQIIAFRKNLGC